MLRGFFEGGYCFLYSTNHDFILTLFSDCRNYILEDIRTKEDKISDIKAKSKDAKPPGGGGESAYESGEGARRFALGCKFRILVSFRVFWVKRHHI